MKKTLIALSVLLAAGSANAAIEAYNKDGVKVDVSAAVEVQAFQSRSDISNKKFYNEDLKFRLDDGDLALNITADINEDLKAIATTGFKYEAKKVENDDLFVGLKHADFGTVTIGRQTTLVDDSGISNDIEFGFGFTGTDGETADLFAVTSGDEVVKYKIKKEIFWAGTSYAQKDNAAKKEEANAFDIGAGLTVGDAAFNAYFQDVEATQPGNKETQNTYQLEATYKISSVKFGASYSDSEIKENKDKLDLNVIKLTTAYTIDSTTFAVGADFGELKTQGQTVEINNYYANVTNKLSSNVSIYAELGYLDSDKLEKIIKADGAKLKLGYVAGLEVKF